LTLTISASKPPTGTIIRYTAKTNSSTASAVTDTTSLVYTSAITFRTNLLITARVFPPPGTNLFPSQILGRNYIFLDPTNNLQTFSSPLPIMIISMQGQGISAGTAPGGLRRG